MSARSDAEAGRVAALLEARSAALAARGRARPGRAPAAGPLCLVCLCGSERYGLPVETVAEVVAGRSCTPVPGGPDALRGAVALAGGIVGVLDLAVLLGLAPGSGEGLHLVRLRLPGPSLALAVDRALGIARAPLSPAALPPGSAAGGFGADAVSGYAPPAPDAVDGAGDGFTVLDLPRLLRRVLP